MLKIKNYFFSNDAKDILNSQKNLIFIRKNGEIKEANKSFLEFFNCNSLDEFKNKFKCVCDFFKKEEGYLYGEDWLDKLLKNPQSQYKVKILKDNQEYIFKIEAVKLKNKTIITLTDITNLIVQKEKLDEVNEILEQYKKAVDELLIVSKTDTKGIITYVNDKFCEISGFSKDELIGKPHNIIRHPDMPKSLFEDMWNTIKKGEVWRGILKNKKKDGGEYWVDTGIMPIKNHKGEIIEYIALRTDITELVKAKEKAQEAERAKGMFLANMSHEIRTPLNAILGFTQLLEKDETLSKKAKEYLRIINSSANTLLKIINDVLDLSKLDAGDFAIDYKEFNPNVSFGDIIYLFKAKAKEKNIEYNISLDKLPNCIVSDEHRLKQVLANLIGNAIKFTPKNGKIYVDIKKLQENENKVKIKFSIKDTGIGIPKDKQKEIFRAFAQADGSITRKFGGTGLGLTISSRIVRKLGGFIEVDSEEGKGSEFYFVLEFDKCNKDIQKEQKEYKVDINTKAKILIAEDDKFNQELIKEIFKKWGIETTIVSNGKEAIEEVKKNRYDLIFLDINMPEMSGLEAIKEIKKITNIPAIALTANAFKEDRENYLNAGFDDFIAKPVKLDEIQYILNKYLQKEDYIHIIGKSLKLNKDTVKHLVNIYFETVAEDLKHLKNAVEDNNLEEIKKLSHKIKGSSLNLKMDEIAKIAENMEKMSKEKVEIDYKKLYEKLKNLVNNIKDKIL